MMFRREHEQEEREEKIREATQMAHLKELEMKMNKIWMTVDSISKGLGCGVPKEAKRFYQTSTKIKHSLRLVSHNDK